MKNMGRYECMIPCFNEEKNAKYMEYAEAARDCWEDFTTGNKLKKKKEELEMKKEKEKKV